MFLLHFLFGLSATLDTPRDGAVEVVLGNPTLVVALVGVGAAGGAGRLGARERLSLGGDLAASLLARVLLGAGLREQSLDPGLVDPVEGAAEDAGEEEVEEDAIGELVRAVPNRGLRG